MEDKYVVFKLHLKQPDTNRNLENISCSESMCGHAGWSCANCRKRGVQSFETLILTKERLEIVIKCRGQEIVPGTSIDEYIDNLVQDGHSKVFKGEQAIVSVVRLSDGHVWGDFGHRYL